MQLGKVSCGSAMRTENMHDDAQNSNEYEDDAMWENVQVGNAETESNGRRLQETPRDFVATMGILMAEMQSYKEDNERLVKEGGEKSAECNHVAKIDKYSEKEEK